MKLEKELEVKPEKIKEDNQSNQQQTIVNNNEIKEYRPVTINYGKYNYHRANVMKQNLLLRAMQVTVDPYKLKNILGFRNVNEVYRTMDKIAMRKEYHDALLRNGIDFDTIIGGIKDLCVNSKSDSVKLMGWQTFIKSLGLDAYKDVPESTRKTWEDTLLEKVEQQKSLDAPLQLAGEYEVNTPEVSAEDVMYGKEEEDDDEWE